MTFFARIFRFLFWLLVVSWSVALLRWLIRRSLQQSKTDGDSGTGTRSEEANERARKLVRDPVCGLHVAEALAVPLRDGQEIVHFCSPACRDLFLREHQRRAANG